MFLFTQAATMLILVLAANTSFADFPRLASFHADDAFMPKQLTKRGHRLVFSNGIIALAIAGAIPVVIFQADVTHLIPLYAIGVFTSFTLSQAGMAKKHITDKEQGWRLGLFVNGLGAVTTGVVTIVIGVFKFSGGAWFIMLLVPILVFLLVRLNHAYESEKEELEHEAALAAGAPILRYHSVIVLIERLDQSSARAIQYARTLTPDDLKAVHIATDHEKAEVLAEEWTRLGLSRLPLELVDCPDRRITRAVLEVVAEAASDRQHRGQRADPPPRVPPVLAPLPARPHRRLDRQGPDRRAPRQRDLRALPPGQAHAGGQARGRGHGHRRRRGRRVHPSRSTGGRPMTLTAATPPTTPEPTAVDPTITAETVLAIGDVRWRQRVRVKGKVRALRVQPWEGGVATLECTIVDDTGGLVIIFMGRRRIGGVALGAHMEVEGMVIENRGRLAVMNPAYTLLPQ